MKSNLQTLLLILVVLLAVSYFFIADKDDDFESELAFPLLVEGINTVDKVSISKNNEILEFNKNNEIWSLQQAQGYIADVNKIAEIMIGLREMQLNSKKTNQAEKHSQLQLDSTGEFAGHRIQLFASGQSLADVYVGKKSKKIDGLFIRLAGEQQTWLVNGGLGIDYSPSEWIVKDIFNIEPEQIAKVDFFPKGSQAFGVIQSQSQPQPQSESAQAPSFVLNPSLETSSEETANIEESKLNSLALGLKQLKINSVVPRKNMPEANEVSKVSYQLLNGKLIELTIYQAADEYLMTVDLAPLNRFLDFEKQLVHWVFKIPSYKFDALNARYESLINP